MRSRRFSESCASFADAMCGVVQPCAAKCQREQLEDGGRARCGVRNMGTGRGAAQGTLGLGLGWLPGGVHDDPGVLATNCPLMPLWFAEMPPRGHGKVQRLPWGALPQSRPQCMRVVDWEGGWEGHGLADISLALAGIVCPCPLPYPSSFVLECVDRAGRCGNVVDSARDSER